MNDKTILLTGATGFLGSYLLDALIRDNYSVIILKRSFSDIWRISHLLSYVKVYDIDKISIEKPFKENEINIIVHAATNYGRKGEKVSDIVETNLLFSLRLLEIAAIFNTNTFINTDTLLYKYLTNYTLSKKQFVEWLKIFSDKIRIVNLRIEHMYGPKDDEAKFLPWLLKELLSEKTEIKLTKGEQKRDFIYISDVVSAYMQVIRNIEQLNGFNELDIGTGRFITIKDFVLKMQDKLEEVFKKAIKTHLNFGAVPYRKGDLEQIDEDTSRLLEIGWKPAFDIDQGLLKTIQWYKNYEKHPV